MRLALTLAVSVSCQGLSVAPSSTGQPAVVDSEPWATLDTTPGTRRVLPQLGPGDIDPAAGFERPPLLSASSLLPLEIRKGPNHEVNETVKTDGFVHVFTVHSDLGDFEVRSDEMLRIRVREIRTLAALREASLTSAFAEAESRAMASPLLPIWSLIRRPGSELHGVSPDVWGKLASEGKRSQLEGVPTQQLLGLSDHKRLLAYELGVDPYTSNAELQRQLERFAWVAFAGGIRELTVPFERQAIPVMARDDPYEAGRIVDLMLTASPEDLRRLNRIELAVTGVSSELSEAFLSHPWYSPRHQTILIESLAGLEPARERGVFIEVALAAGSEEDALFYQRVAELMRAYHDHVAPVERVIPLQRAVGGVTDEGTLVVPVVADHVVWTQPTAAFADRLVAELEARPGIRGVEILLSGTVSPLLRHHFERRGLYLTERCFERLRREPKLREERL